MGFIRSTDNLDITRRDNYSWLEINYLFTNDLTS